MQFSTVFHDFTASSIQSLVRQFGIPKTVVEIGVFEGHSTFNMTALFANQFKDYKHYAIDPYGESDDLPDDVVVKAGEVFCANLAEFELKDHIEFINKPSVLGLMNLYQRGVKADLIYVDGDHRAGAVMEDLVLGFQLLDTGGIILCDDCTFWRNEKLQNTPKLAVDSFVNCFYDRIELVPLPHGHQIAFRKK